MGLVPGNVVQDVENRLRINALKIVLGCLWQLARQPHEHLPSFSQRFHLL